MQIQQRTNKILTAAQSKSKITDQYGFRVRIRKPREKKNNILVFSLNKNIGQV